MRAVEFSKGDYAALLVPDMGANLVRLADTRRGIEILRAPAGDEVEEFRRRPHVFGLPILFPPNRIADGQYTFDGRTYRFPITDAKGGHYHHGILKSQPFAVSKAWETADEVLVECRYYSNAGNDAIFRDFPHEFKCKIVYRLTAGGLEQEDVRQPQQGADARRRGVPYADADSLRRRCGRRLRDACGDWRTS
jgi:aldose 1-epimerase